MRVPQFLRRLYAGWMTIARAIGTVMGAILLTVLWIVLFGPYALLYLFKAKPAATGTYWHSISPKAMGGLEHPY
jgi:hypothetical protein